LKLIFKGEQLLAIEAKNLKKIYKLSKLKKLFPPKKEVKYIKALKGINLEIKKGEIFGLLGPNGAGKTTTIKILASLLIPDEGYAKVLGFDTIKDANEVKKKIGLVIGGNQRLLYNKLTAIENLLYFSSLYGVDKKTAYMKSNFLLKTVGLGKWKDILVENFSTGMIQKLAIAKSLVHDPDIILMDEPTLGLDPRAAKNIRQFIKEKLNEEMGKTILLTTHYMQEAEELVNRVAIIKDGIIVAEGEPNRLKKLVRDEVIELLISNCYKNPREILLDDICVKNVSVDLIDEAIGVWRIRLALKCDEAINRIINILLSQNGAKLKKFYVDEPTLEDVFLVLTNPIKEGY
jgi:ABC-2 type transport system ATP-binding protein